MAKVNYKRQKLGSNSIRIGAPGDYQQPFLLPLSERDVDEGVVFRNSFVTVQPSSLHGLGSIFYLFFEFKSNARIVGVFAAASARQKDIMCLIPGCVVTEASLAEVNLRLYCWSLVDLKRPDNLELSMVNLWYDSEAFVGSVVGPDRVGHLVNTCYPFAEQKDIRTANVEYIAMQVRHDDGSLEWVASVVAVRAIEEGEELLADYHWQLTPAQVQRSLSATLCRCSMCKSARRSMGTMKGLATRGRHPQQRNWVYNILLRVIVREWLVRERVQFTSAYECARAVGIEKNITESSLRRVFSLVSDEAWESGVLVCCCDDWGLVGWTAAVVHNKLRTVISLTASGVYMKLGKIMNRVMRDRSDDRVQYVAPVIKLYVECMQLSQMPACSIVFIPFWVPPAAAYHLFKVALSSRTCEYLICFCKKVFEDARAAWHKNFMNGRVAGCMCEKVVLMPCGSVVSVYVIRMNLAPCMDEHEVVYLRSLVNYLAEEAERRGDMTAAQSNQAAIAEWEPKYNEQKRRLLQLEEGLAQVEGKSHAAEEGGHEVASGESTDEGMAVKERKDSGSSSPNNAYGMGELNGQCVVSGAGAEMVVDGGGMAELNGQCVGSGAGAEVVVDGELMSNDAAEEKEAETDMAAVLGKHCCSRLCLQKLTFVQLQTVRMLNTGETVVRKAASRQQVHAIPSYEVSSKAVGKLIWRKLLEIALAAHDIHNTRTWKFEVSGNAVCRSAWILANGWKKSRVNAYIQRIKNGERTLYINTNTAEINTTSAPGSKAAAIAAWLTRYAKEMGDFLPTTDDGGRCNVIHLPQTYKKQVWEEYCVAHRNQPALLCTRQYFCEVWSRHAALVRRSRLGGSMMSRCTLCEEYKSALRRSVTEEESDAVYEQYRGHLLLQSLERKAYYSRKDMAMKYKSSFLSCILDGMDQSKLHIPNLNVAVKATFRLHNVVHGLFGAYFHGHGAFMGISPPYVASGGNLSCQILYEALCYIKQENEEYAEHGLPRTLLIQADNCGKDVKNRCFIGFCAAMIESGVFDRIVLSFLLKGHTHEDIDQIFSVIAHHLRTKDVLSQEELEQYAAKAYSNSAGQVKKCIVRGIHGTMNFTKLLTGKQPRYPGVPDEALREVGEECLDSKFGGHRQPHNFVLDAHTTDGVRKCILRYRSFCSSEMWYPRPEDPREFRELNAEKEAVAVGNATRSACARLGDEGEEGKGNGTEAVQSIAAGTVESSISVVGDSGCGEGEQRSVAAERNTDGMHGADSVSLVEQLERSFYQSESILRYESQKSLQSYSDSPGIQVLTRAVDWSNLELAHPREFAGPAVEAMQQDVKKFFALPVVKARHEAEKLTAAEASWDRFFNDIPTLQGDVRGRTCAFDINTLLPDNAREAPGLAVRHRRVRELVQCAEPLEYAGRGPVSFSGHSSGAVRRAEQERAEEEELVAIERGKFVVVLRDTESVREVDGMNDEERELSFDVGKVVQSADVPSASEVVTVEWWRCPSGDPNKAYSRAVVTGTRSRGWRQVVERSSVLIVNFTLTGGGRLPAAVRRKIGRAREVPEWVYVARRGLVRV